MRLPENTAEAGNTEAGHIGNPAMKVSFARFAGEKVVPCSVVIAVVIARDPENLCQTGNFFEFDVQRSSAIQVAQKDDCLGQSVIPLGLEDVLDDVPELPWVSPQNQIMAGTPVPNDEAIATDTHTQRIDEFRGQRQTPHEVPHRRLPCRYGCAMIPVTRSNSGSLEHQEWFRFPSTPGRGTCTAAC